jgi:hypothetical protein
MTLSARLSRREAVVYAAAAVLGVGIPKQMLQLLRNTSTAARFNSQHRGHNYLEQTHTRTHLTVRSAMKSARKRTNEGCAAAAQASSLDLVWWHLRLQQLTRDRPLKGANLYRKANSIKVAAGHRREMTKK